MWGVRNGSCRERFVAKDRNYIYYMFTHHGGSFSEYWQSNSVCLRIPGGSCLLTREGEGGRERKGTGEDGMGSLACRFGLSKMCVYSMVEYGVGQSSLYVWYVREGTFRTPNIFGI